MAVYIIQNIFKSLQSLYLILYFSYQNFRLEKNKIIIFFTLFQIRGSQLLDSVRLYKQGFPVFMPLSEFRRRFRLLAGDFNISSPVLDERKAVEDMLMAMDLELSSYRVGLSQVSCMYF